jgi:sucrose phosphorylase
LVQAMRKRGGHVSTRREAGGQSLPYELNISYVDALGDPEDRDHAAHARRFLTSQGIMLALRGIPGVYFHSLVGTENDADGVRKTRQPRTINRRKFHLSQLERQLDDEASLAGRIFEGYRGLLKTRAAQPAFHPDAAQIIHRIHDAVLAVQRTSRDGSQHIVSLANLSREPIDVRLSAVANLGTTHDLITAQPDAADRRILLLPHQLVWLTNKPGGTP